MNVSKNKDKEILIVDDNPENLKFLAKSLQDNNYKVRLARNGKQVIESIKTSEPDLIFMDVHMPEMDGIEACNIIINQMNKYYLPIIFLSALSDTYNIVKAFKSGASDYIIKPFQLPELEARIQHQLYIREKLLQLREYEQK